MSRGESFKEELEEELVQAGLRGDARSLIGRMYEFNCEHGSHHYILVGTITAFYISDEGGLEFYVTNPEIWGQKIRSIMKMKKGWAVVVDAEKVEERFFFGELYLF